jgi:ABC-type antimicrobial peptide transport system permease subunit
MLSNDALLINIISIISLHVGGLSINVILSSITECIHKKGVRKALATKRLQIFVQFTVETITLCCVGETIGRALGAVPFLFLEAIYKSTNGAIGPTLSPIISSAFLGSLCSWESASVSIPLSNLHE